MYKCKINKKRCTQKTIQNWKYHRSFCSADQIIGHMFTTNTFIISHISVKNKMAVQKRKEKLFLQECLSKTRLNKTKYSKSLTLF